MPLTVSRGVIIVTKYSYKGQQISIFSLVRNVKTNNMTFTSAAATNLVPTYETYVLKSCKSDVNFVEWQPDLRHKCGVLHLTQTPASLQALA